MFVGILRPFISIEAREFSVLAITEGIWTITFIYSKDKNRHIDIENVNYFSLVAKNLISVLQWSTDKRDDAGVISKQQYSIFNWVMKNIVNSYLTS